MFPQETITVEKIVEVPVPLDERFLSLKKFLMSYEAAQPIRLFSSNNSLKRCFSYGDANDQIRIIEDTISALMLDKPMDTEYWSVRRSESLIRNMFLAMPQGIDNTEKVFTEIRLATIRLVDGYSLRKTHPETGTYVFHNLRAAERLLLEMESFFGELFNEFRRPDSRP